MSPRRVPLRCEPCCADARRGCAHAIGAPLRSLQARRAAEGDPRGAAVTAAATAALEWLDSALITDLAETDSALASLVAAVREARLLRPPAAPARSVAEPPAPASSASPASPSQPPGRMSIAPWACAACTFINEDSLAAECAVCESPRAASAASAAGAGEAAPGSATGRRRRSLEGDAEAARLQVRPGAGAHRFLTCGGTPLCHHAPCVSVRGAFAGRAGQGACGASMRRVP